MRAVNEAKLVSGQILNLPVTPYPQPSSTVDTSEAGVFRPAPAQ